MSKTMVVGLTPEYVTYENNSSSDYASKLHSTNHGAAFITRSIMKIFDGDFIDINEEHDFNELRNKYSNCVVATASQLGPERDLSKLVNFIEKVDLKTFFLSGGVDAGGKYGINYRLHPSLIRLLDICSSNGSWIGVRGDLSAYYLHKHGYKSCVPVGCPTIYSNGLLDYDYEYPSNNENMGVPFHWAISAALINKGEKYNYIGQDIFDDELFKGNLAGSVVSKIAKVFKKPYKEISEGVMNSISSASVFPATYFDWYDLIGKQQKILSGRLHANICGLTQGVPSILVPWDMRTYELVSYLELPHVSWETLRDSDLNDVFKHVDFEGFKKRIKNCYANWISFNEENGLEVHTGKELSDLSPLVNTEWKQSARILNNITQYTNEEKYTKFKTVGDLRLMEWVSDKLGGRERL
jgi:hypothetical protein